MGAQYIYNIRKWVPEKKKTFFKSINYKIVFMRSFVLFFFLSSLVAYVLLEFRKITNQEKWDYSETIVT